MPIDLAARASGILLHPTSLPGPHGIGDLGPAAYHFVDWLERAGQRLWQWLPTYSVIYPYIRIDYMEIRVRGVFWDSTEHLRVRIVFSSVTSQGTEVSLLKRIEKND